MKQPTDMGMNRTGMAMSPVDGKRMLENAQIPVPTFATTGPATTGHGVAGTTGPTGGVLPNVNELGRLRATYIENAPPIGTVPPPTTVKGMATAMLELLKGKKGNVLIDKLAARMAFERTGARLYGAMVNKMRIAGGAGTEKTVKMLEKFQQEEINHFNMLWGVLEGIGADPTAMTPGADIEGVTSTGLLQTVTDPRTTPMQCMHALQIAELADNDSWTMLIDVVQTLNHKELVEQFRMVMQEEQQHLAQVRGVVQEMVRKELGA